MSLRQIIALVGIVLVIVLALLHTLELFPLGVLFLLAFAGLLL